MPRNIHAYLAIPVVVLAGIAAVTATSGRADVASDPVSNALSAAPPSLAEGATVVDWEGNVLREGTNGYTCLPDPPDAPNDSPMCLDAGWMRWLEAFGARDDPPRPATMAFGYMLQGDMPTSNSTPFVEDPASVDDWLENSGPHVMVLVPDPAMLEGISDDPHNGGPWVMYGGTPYEHLMIPAAKRD